MFSRRRTESHIPYHPIDGMEYDDLASEFESMEDASNINPRKHALGEELARRASVAGALSELDALRELDERGLPYAVRSTRA